MQKQLPSNFLVNVTVLMLLVYLILAVELLRNVKYSGLPGQAREQDINLNEGNPLAVQESKPLTAELVAPSPPPTVRRRPRQPSCVSSGKRARTFPAIFSGHRGSTAIMSELREHSQVLVEKFEPVDHQQVFNTTEALEIAHDYFDREIAHGKVPGFKIRPTHIKVAPERWRTLAKQYGSRIIWQYGMNLFKASVGEYTNRYLNNTSVIEGLEQDISAEER